MPEQLELFKRRKAIVVFSGGQDSTTCLFHALSKGFEVYPLTFDYKQRHDIEINAAHMVLKVAKGQYPGHVKEHEVVQLGPVLKGTSPLVSGEHLEQYDGPEALPGVGIEKTFVPMRNQLFLTIAANRAAIVGAGVLVTGVCEADSGGYPDCRQGFIKALEDACNLGTFTEEAGAFPPLEIVTPLMDMSKAESVIWALSLPGCYKALAYSHTAYDGQFPPLGHDHANLLRAKGFLEANVPDPLVLRAWSMGLMDLPNTENYNCGKLEKFMKLAEL